MKLARASLERYSGTGRFCVSCALLFLYREVVDISKIQSVAGHAAPFQLHESAKKEQINGLPAFPAVVLCRFCAPLVAAAAGVVDSSHDVGDAHLLVSACLSYLRTPFNSSLFSTRTILPANRSYHFLLLNYFPRRNNTRPPPRHHRCVSHLCKHSTFRGRKARGQASGAKKDKHEDEAEYVYYADCLVDTLSLVCATYMWNKVLPADWT